MTLRLVPLGASMGPARTVVVPGDGFNTCSLGGFSPASSAMEVDELFRVLNMYMV